MTRLRDVVEPRLSRAKRVLDVSDGSWISGFLHLPDGVELIATTPGELAATVQPDDLVVDAMPSQSRDDGLLVSVRTITGHLAVGASAVLLTRDPAAELPLESIERVGALAGCQLLEVAELAYQEWPTAVVLSCGAEPGTAEVAAGAAVVVRRSFHRAAASGGSASRPTDESAALLKEQIADRELTIRRMRREAKALRGSMGNQLGSALIEAARNPASAPRLPVRLVKIWRNRRSSGGAVIDEAQETPAAAKRTASATVTEDSRLVGWSGAPTDRTVRPEIFGIVTDPDAEMLSRHSTLRRLLPHEARFALEQGLPDLVLIQAGALLAPSAWGHTASPGGAVSYARALWEMTVIAAAHGIPVVVWQDVRSSMTPALADLIRRADLVIGDRGRPDAPAPWSPGVSLAEFHPGVKTVHDKVLVLPERRVVGAAARVRRDLARSGQGTVPTSPGLADAIRAHAVTLASPFGRSASVSDLTLASIASGARVLSGPNDKLLGGFPSAVLPVIGQEAAVGAAEAALAMPEMSAAESRSNLRRIFDHHATPVRLGWLTATLGLQPDPLADRRVTVVVEGDARRDTAAAIDNVLSQSNVPDRIVVTAGEVPDRVLDEARALGVDVAVSGSHRDWPAVAAATDTAWVTVWPAAPAPRELLHDLVAAAECVGADAVGTQSGSPAGAGYGRFVETLPVEGSLIRRDRLPRLPPGADLGALAQEGLRLYAVSNAGSDR